MLRVACAHSIGGGEEGIMHHEGRPSNFKFFSGGVVGAVVTRLVALCLHLAVCAKNSDKRCFAYAVNSEFHPYMA